MILGKKFKLLNNVVFGTTVENVRKRIDKMWDIKLVTTKERMNYTVSEPNYHTVEYFSKNLLAIQIKKTKLLMN